MPDFKYHAMFDQAAQAQLSHSVGYNVSCRFDNESVLYRCNKVSLNCGGVMMKHFPVYHGIPHLLNTCCSWGRKSTMIRLPEAWQSSLAGVQFPIGFKIAGYMDQPWYSVLTLHRSSNSSSLQGTHCLLNYLILSIFLAVAFNSSLFLVSPSEQFKVKFILKTKWLSYHNIYMYYIYKAYTMLHWTFYIILVFYYILKLYYFILERNWLSR